MDALKHWCLRSEYSGPLTTGPLQGAKYLFCGSFKLAQQSIAPLDSRIQRNFCGFITGPECFHLFVDDITDLYEITKAQAARVWCWFIQTQLQDRSVCTRVTVIEPLCFGQLIGRSSYRHIAGFLMPPRLNFGRRQVGRRRWPLVLPCRGNGKGKGKLRDSTLTPNLYILGSSPLTPRMSS